ncbi:MAG: transketolase, partial [Candidatus Kapabacteria bacterium]|nr:transketolase [Candidatus Kapabacteria bacterium]
TAHALRADNLIAVVDRNLFQANTRTEELIPLEPLATKFEAFGWNVENADGHDFSDLDEVFKRIPNRNGMPTVVIADTQRGRGVPSISERADRWFCNFTHDEIDALIDELHGKDVATLTSETLVVR